MTSKVSGSKRVCARTRVRPLTAVQTARRSAVAARCERIENGDVRVAGIRRTGAHRSIKYCNNNNKNNNNSNTLIPNTRTTLVRVCGLTFGRRVRKRKWSADAVADGSGRSYGLAGAVENARLREAAGLTGSLRRMPALKTSARSIRRSSLVAVVMRAPLCKWCLKCARHPQRGPDGFANPWRRGCPRLFYPRPATARTAHDDTRSRDERVMRIQYKRCRFSFNRAAFAFCDR